MSFKRENDLMEKFFGLGRRGDLETSSEEAIDTLRYLIAGGFISAGSIATAVVYGRSIWVLGVSVLNSFMQTFNK